MRPHIVQRDGQLPLRFQGDVISFAENEKMILLIFKTEAGNIIGEKIILASMKCDERHDGSVLASRLDLAKFFGTSSLARGLIASLSPAVLPDTGFEDIP